MIVFLGFSTHSDAFRHLRNLFGEFQKKPSFFIVWGCREMSYIQFCRASQALSIGIWLNLNSEKVWKKKFTNMKMVWYLISLKIGKIWCQRSIFEFNYFTVRTFWYKVKYTIRCRIKWATKWYKKYFDDWFLPQVFHQKTETSAKFCMSKKHCFLTFSVQYRDWGEMRHKKFCRASEALSIVTGLNLNSE